MSGAERLQPAADEMRRRGQLGNAAGARERDVINRGVNRERVAKPDPGIEFGKNDQIRPDAAQQLTMQIIRGPGHHPGHPEPFQHQRREGACLQVLALGHDPKLGPIDRQRPQQLFVRSVGLRRQRHVLRRLGHDLLVNVDGGDFVPLLEQRPGHAAAEPPQPNHGHTLWSRPYQPDRPSPSRLRAGG